MSGKSRNQSTEIPVSVRLRAEQLCRWPVLDDDDDGDPDDFGSFEGCVCDPLCDECINEARTELAAEAIEESRYGA